MASTYSSLKIQLMTTGENSGTWGNVTNVNLGTAIEEAIVGSANVTFSSGNVTLTLTDSNSSQTARNLRLNLTGTTAGARDLIVPAIEKIYLVNNGCADAVTVKNTTGTGIAVPAGKTMYVYNNGTNVVDAVTHLTSLTLASALPVISGGTGVTTSTGSGNVVLSTSPTLATPVLGTPTSGTLTNCTGLPLTTGVTGVLPNANTTAASANGASTIVARDASGNFIANTITSNVTGNLTGTAANATILQTTRTIAISGGATGTATSFNGSANITIPVTGLNVSTADSGTLAVTRGGTGVTTSTGTGSVVLSASPTLSGTPLAPTAVLGTNTTQIATTAFAIANGIPSGAIVMWSGSIASIPSGWFLCDGANSTPDLRNRFIVGAGSTYAVAATGGSADAIVVSHTHTATSTVSDPGHNHKPSTEGTTGGFATNQPALPYLVSRSGVDGGPYTSINTTTSATNITVATTVASAGSSGTNANLPPYYALAYIMKA
jgi:hypothetical protein